jgi:hypothetical protein
MIKQTIMSLLQISTSQVANWISLFSAIGTVGAFIFLIIQERRNSKKVDTLSEQLRLTKLQMKIQARPEFILDRVVPNNMQRTVHINVVNIGEKAIITEINYDDNEAFDWSGMQTPSTVLKDYRIQFVGTALGKLKFASDTNFKISIFYQDVYYNKYVCLINGNSKEPKIDILEIDLAHYIPPHL